MKGPDSARSGGGIGVSIKAVGLVVFTIFLSAALLAPVISPADPRTRFDPYQPPSWHNPLGTNDMGNDLLSELIYGSRISIAVGFGAAILATVLGAMVGLVAGYYRGWMDEVLMGLTDVVLMIPQIPLIITLAAFLRPSFWMIALLMGLLWWTSMARVVRSRAMQVREMNFVESARCLGFPAHHIILSDVLPNTIHVVLPKFMLTVASAMIAEASISFLGLVDPSARSWGTTISLAFSRGGFINGYWWWYLPPGMCITLFVLSLVMISLALEEDEVDTGIKG
ncbi:MAG TPA: ABC transporter permease [Methanothrix sp.]|nr:ABC transporter permease [Methanothrix sp.]HPJ83915.1 ABC transporter permease [Methanothrix sp.]HPR66116.1 ABC transporter permease [Methanothrix sp.]